MTQSESQFWVARCNAADAKAAWPRALPLLAPAIARSSGLFEPDDVLERVTRPASGTQFDWSLWLIGEGDELLGAWTTKIDVYPREKIVETVFGGGRDLARWMSLAIDELEKFAREAGCTRLRCAGRRGFARHGYYAVLGHILERRLAS